ncbi:hypothetical protein SPURM210S_02935 [Streptomyces purpurascens]
MQHEVPGVPELFSWEFATDPYPAYAWLREHAPVHRTKLPSGVEAWLVTRYADAKQTLADNRLSKNPAHHHEPAHAKGKTGIPGERKAELMTHLLNIDPPDHTRLRRLVSKAFTPRRVAEFEQRVQELTDGLIDGFAEQGSADLIHEFAFPLPIYAICDLLGVPREDQDDFRDWAGMMIRHQGGPRGGVARSVKRMRGYLADLIHRKREVLPAEPTPGEDLISGLIRASDHGEHLTENEAAAMAFILLFAGFEDDREPDRQRHLRLAHPPRAAHPAPGVPRRRGERPPGDRRRGTPALRRPRRARHLALRDAAAHHRRAAHRGRRPGARRPGRRGPGPGAVRPIRTCSTSPAATTSTSDTATASTTASAPPSPAWRARPPSPRSSPASRTSGSPPTRPS